MLVCVTEMSRQVRLHYTILLLNSSMYLNKAIIIILRIEYDISKVNCSVYFSSAKYDTMKKKIIMLTMRATAQRKADRNYQREGVVKGRI